MPLLLLTRERMRPLAGVDHGGAAHDDLAGERLDFGQGAGSEGVGETTAVRNPCGVVQNQFVRADARESPRDVIGDGADEIALADDPRGVRSDGDRRRRSGNAHILTP